MFVFLLLLLVNNLNFINGVNGKFWTTVLMLLAVNGIVIKNPLKVNEIVNDTAVKGLMKY